MTGVMDLKHILCEPMEQADKQGLMMMMHPQHHHPLEFNDNYRERSISTHRLCRSNSMSGNNSNPYTLTPRKRVHSEHYRTSPLWGYLNQPLYHDEVLIAPLTTSLSTTMVPTLSSSSTSSSFSSDISPSSSTSSSPTQQQKKSTHDYSPLATQTRNPWTPIEDDLLQKGYEQGLSWAMISANFLPHRSRGCCWGRFKTLQSKNLVDVKIQQQSRLARRAWKNIDIKKST